MPPQPQRPPLSSAQPFRASRPHQQDKQAAAAYRARASASVLSPSSSTAHFWKRQLAALDETSLF